jgi:hypothetical protein
MLFVYVSADSYLKPGGRLGFVITGTLFKTKGAGDGFRRLQLGQSEHYLRVQTVEEMGQLQPFEGATNQTAIVVLTTGTRPTTYPVPYTVWRKSERGQIPQDATLEAVQARTTRSNLHARPVDSVYTSPWLTARHNVLTVLRKVIGKSPYRAYEGANTGGLNGVYWVRVVMRRPDGLLVIENLGDVGRIRVPVHEAAVEPTLVYPLVRGRDVQRWRSSPSAHILVPQDRVRQREGIPEHRLKVDFPATYAYLKTFEAQLSTRADRKYYPEGAPFYTMRNVAAYTMLPFKVVWREQAASFTASVLPPSDEGQCSIPDHKLMFVPTDDGREAWFLAAVFNSAPMRVTVDAYANSLATSTHVLEFVSVPKFQASDVDHMRLAELGQAAYAVAQVGTAPVAVEQEIDERAGRLWELTSGELKVIRSSLSERVAQRAQARVDEGESAADHDADS